jgi:hypothetical protein
MEIGILISRVVVVIYETGTPLVTRELTVLIHNLEFWQYISFAPILQQVALVLIAMVPKING